ncbi:MAG: hypothetical protein SOU51_03890 [Collinsella sp.]|nr:hypothetical protein [Collinsella sp.]
MDTMIAFDMEPDVRMMDLVAVPYVAAMGVVRCLRERGLGSLVGIGWPHDVVAWTDPSGPGAGPARELVGISVHARSRDGVLVASVEASLSEGILSEVVSAAGVDGALLGDLGRDVRSSIEAEVERWAGSLRGRVVPGPLAPVLSEYFDMVPLLGHRVAALSPNGIPVAMGFFRAIDVWGRATILTDQGEREFPAEAVRIVPLPTD